MLLGVQCKEQATEGCPPLHCQDTCVCQGLHMPSQGPEEGSVFEACFPTQPAVAEVKEQCVCCQGDTWAEMSQG